MAYSDDNTRLFMIRSQEQISVEQDTIRNREVCGEFPVQLVEFFGHLTDSPGESGDETDIIWYGYENEWFFDGLFCYFRWHVAFALD